MDSFFQRILKSDFFIICDTLLFPQIAGNYLFVLYVFCEKCVEELIFPLYKEPPPSLLASPWLNANSVTAIICIICWFSLWMRDKSVSFILDIGISLAGSFTFFSTEIRREHGMAIYLSLAIKWKVLILLLLLFLVIVTSCSQDNTKFFEITDILLKKIT